ncbi:MAG: tetratricopeptide repeat protein [Saprospiraceae bacterium]|jgi:tetratricopeptide (TPR) repeat protein|nr:tetratricopeptide repeat protein [Saprospiraceae bacterium]
MNRIFSNRTCLTTEEIKLYLGGKLADGQRFEIENHLLDCPLCADAVEGLIDSVEIIEELPRAWPQKTSNDGDIIPITRGIHNTDHKTNWYRLAAVFTGIIVFAGIAYQYFAVTNTKKLFANAYNFLPPPDSYTRSVDRDSLNFDTLDGSMVLYGQQKFSEAIDAFEQRLKRSPKDSQTYLYAGICYLETNKPDVAIDYLKKARINSQQFYPAATWYLALTYIKTGKISEANILLKELNETENEYQQKAKELLTEINQ